jgi:hypothetical protein
MRKRLFFLIVFGLVLSLATKAQSATTTQLIKVSVSVADKIYDGTTTIPVSSVTPTFTDAEGATLTGPAPSYEIVSATLVGNQNAEVVEKVVNVAIKLTDQTQGYAFSAGTAATAYETTVSGKVTIEQRPITATSATVKNKVYDGKTTGTVDAVVFSGVVTGETPAYTATVTFADANVGTGVSASVDITVPVTGNYVLDPNPTTGLSATADITKKAISVTSITVDSNNVVYPATVSVTGATFSGLVNGETLVFTTDYTTSAIPQNAAVHSETVTVTLASSAKAGNYDLGTNNTGTAAYTVNAAPVTVTATADQKVYDGAIFTPAYTVSDPSITLTGALATTPAASANVGEYTIGVGTLAATDGNYYINFVPAVYKITPAPLAITANNVNAIYGATLPAVADLTYAITSGALVGTDAITGTLAYKAGVKTDGTQPIGAVAEAIEQGSLTAGGNYAITFTKGNLTVGAAELTVVPDAGQYKTWRQEDPILTYKVTGLKAGDTASSVLTGALGRDAGEDVGIYNITPGTLAVKSGSNYTITLDATPVTFEIRKALVVVKPDAFTKVYDNDPSTDEYNYTLLRGDEVLVVGTDVNFTSGGTLTRANTSQNVGTYAYSGDVTTWVDDNCNFILVSNPESFKITPATLTIVPPAGLKKAYGAADPNPYFELIDGTTVTGYITAAAPTFAQVIGTQKVTKRAAGNNIGTYAYNITGITDQSDTKNYKFVLVDNANTFEIIKATLTVTINANQSKVYGGADPALTYTVTGLISPDNASDVVEGLLERAPGEDVGIYTITPGTLAVKSGSNYTITLDATPVTFKIKKAPKLSVTADANGKVYGDITPEVLTYTATGLKNGDKEADVFTGLLTRVAGEDVGTYAITSLSLTLTSGNYEGFNFVTGSLFTITPAELTVNGSAASKVYGTADPATFTPNVTGWKLTDGASLLTGKLAREAGENAGTYKYTIGTLKAGNNYTLTLLETPVFTITKAPVTVTAIANTKVFGQVDPELDFTVSGLLTVPALSIADTKENAFTGALGRVAGENVGTYAITQGTLDAANYAITFVSADFTITKATEFTEDDLTIAWPDPNPVYDGNPYVLPVSIAGIPANAFVVTYNGREGAPVNAGEYEVIVIIAATPNNDAIAITLSKPFVIEKADQVLTFNALAPIKNGDTFALNASVNIGLVLTYASSDETVATVGATGIVTAKKVGKTNITVSQAGTVNYKAVSKTQELVVEKGTGIDNIVAEGQVSIYPSVAQRNSTITLDANVNVKNAELAVYSINGKLISVTPVINTVTTLSAPLEAGAYIYVFKAEGINKTMKVLVK